jgi:NAD(P)-dependent dehydrogenase (short-subunit alcohol dehydrogenase family)
LTSSSVVRNPLPFETGDELAGNHVEAPEQVGKGPARRFLHGQHFDAYGRVDVLVNNAGVMPLSLMEELRIDEWNQMVDVNLRGVLHGIAAVLLWSRTNADSAVGRRTTPRQSGSLQSES